MEALNKHVRVSRESNGALRARFKQRRAKLNHLETAIDASIRNIESLHNHTQLNIKTLNNHQQSHSIASARSAALKRQIETLLRATNQTKRDNATLRSKIEEELIDGRKLTHLSVRVRHETKKKQEDLRAKKKILASSLQRLKSCEIKVGMKADLVSVKTIQIVGVINEIQDLKKY